MLEQKPEATEAFTFSALAKICDWTKSWVLLMGLTPQLKSRLSQTGVAGSERTLISILT